MIKPIMLKNMTQKEMRINVANNLRYIRKELNTTRVKMAEGLGINEKSFAASEEARAINLELVFNMARHTKVSMDTLLTTDMSKGGQENE